MEDESVLLPIESLLEPKTVLRLVNRDSIEYLELLHSLRDDGFLNSICVRPAGNRYEIIDGLYRYSCAKQLGLQWVPCLVKHDVDEDKFLAMQLKANALRPETKPAEYALHMKKLLTRNPEMSFNDLAVAIRKQPFWIKERMGLLRLRPHLQLAVDRGEISVANGYKLSRIPPRLQELYVEQAKTLPYKEFAPIAAAAVKQYTEAVKQGKMEAFWTVEFKPQAYLRSLVEVREEADRQEVGPFLIASEVCQTPLDGFYLALRWAMHLDARSVHEQEQKARRRANTESKVPYDPLDE